SMDIKRFIIAGVVVYVVYQILGFLIHEVILSGPYASLESLWRPEEKTWIFWLTGLLWAALFTFIYTKGYEGKGVMEGVRYGLWIGLFVSVPMAFNSYAVLPVPASLALQWFIYGTLQTIICGVVVAVIYKPARAAAPEGEEGPREIPPEEPGV
ncbi:hypothetical protein MYX84_12235, partial [Acidobacteria bacterium AH-259-O06]|nr:hypothetical protein [Acidobacteria bacterium AH-259-O06]